MLDALKVDPNTVLKRIGDGFYEQQLIQQQIIQTTGQRFIGDYTDNQSEYQALMANVAKASQHLGLNVGTALTDAGMAALTSDIVWLVNQTVTLPNGSRQTVLVPQVYLRANAVDVTGEGTIITNIVGANANANANANEVIAEVGGRIRVAARPTQYERIEECERWGCHMAPADSASQRRCRARTAMRIAMILFRFPTFPRPNPDPASNWKAARALRFEASSAGTAPHRPTFACRHRSVRRRGDSPLLF